MKVYRIKCESYYGDYDEYLLDEVYLSKETAIKHKPKDIDNDHIGSIYKVIEQETID